MSPALRRAFERELELGRRARRERRWDEAMRHLERAHVLGQRHAWPHTVNHWWMLKVGLRTRDAREIFGQILRIAVAGIGSLIGRAPVGNTGGANVGILTPMPIPEDLAAIFRKAGV